VPTTVRKEKNMARQHKIKALFLSPAPILSEVSKRIMRDNAFPQHIAVHVERYLRSASTLRTSQPQPVRGKTHKQTYTRLSNIEAAAKRFTFLIDDQHMLNLMIDCEADLLRTKAFDDPESFDEAMRAIEDRVRKDFESIEAIRDRARKLMARQKRKSKQKIKTALKAERRHQDDLLVWFWRRWIKKEIQVAKTSAFVKFFDSVEKELSGGACELPRVDALRKRFGRFL
jgi:hypothetical protein